MGKRSASRSQGPLLGAYQCTRLLARGGGGEVWVAQRSGGQDEDLVIKIALAEDVMIEALRREWDNLFDIPSAALPLPVAWLDASDDGRPGIVMERRAGRPLGEALRGASPDFAAQVIAGALDALVALHAAGLVHGDLHPDNVLVDDAANVSLLDLGLSQAPGDLPAHGAGLPAFAAPERLRGEGVDARDDLFSLAASAWHALVGEHPFRDYPAFMPARHDRPSAVSGELASLLDVLSAWLSPARELRPVSADVARREWSSLVEGDAAGGSSAAVMQRPWRWGRWKEPALPQANDGAVQWVTGPSGSGRSGALRAVEAQARRRGAATRVAWLRPAPGDYDALAALEADVQRLTGPLPELEQSADAATSFGLGERGGPAGASMQRRVERARRALGPDAWLLVDDFDLLNEALQTALAGQRTMAGGSRLIVAAGSAPAGRTRFELPAAVADEVSLAMNAATGRSHDLELCRAVADAVGADRAAIAPMMERLAADGHVHEEHGRVSPAVTGDELVAACRALADELSGETAAALPDSDVLQRLLAHVAVSDVCHPGRGGDPAPQADAAALAAMRAVRRMPGGAFAVSSGRHREYLLNALDDTLIAEAARDRAAWLADRAPIEALELRVLSGARSGDKLPKAIDVVRGCDVLTNSAQPGRAARLAAGWLGASSGRRGKRTVTVAAMHAAVARGRLQEVEELAATLTKTEAANAQVQLALADRAFRAGDYPAASTCAQAAAADAGTNDALLAAASMIEAFAATWQGDLDGAAGAITRGRNAKPNAAVADQFSYLEALANYYRGDLVAARAVFAKLDESHAAAVRAAAAAGVGLCAHRDGDLKQARQSYDRSRRLAEVAGDRSRVLNMTMNIAVLDHEAGDLGAALSGYERVIDDARRLGNRGALVRSLNNRGNLLTLIGDHDRAETDLEAALSALQEVGNQYLEGNVHCLLAEIARKSSKPQVARDRIGRAVEALTAAAAEAELLEIRIEQAEIALASGDIDSARDIASQTLDEAVRLANDEVRARAAWLLARCELLALGADLRSASEPLREIADKLADCAAAVPDGKPLLRVAIDTDRAVVAALIGDVPAAVELARDALARLDRVAATLDPSDASIFRGGIVHAPRISLLRLVANMQAMSASTTAAPTVNLGTALMGTVLALNRRLSGEHDLPRLLEVLMDAAVTLTGAERGFLVLDDRAAPKAVSDMSRAGEPELRVAIARNLDQENLRKAAHKLSWSVAVRVFEDGDRMVTTDASVDPRLAEQASVHAANLRSILCVPLALRGRTIGVLYVDNRFTSGAFSQDHASVLEALAAQAAIAIHTARLITRYSRSQKQLEASKAEVEELNEQLKEDLSSTEEALHSARQALDAQRLEIERRSDYGQIKGESQPLRRLFSLMDRVRKHDFPVVVIGESGTGKELVARAIHFTGARRRGPFVAINCGAVPENLLESELFGHVRGAFTGAVAERDGLFVSADRGTLFLDEVGEMPLAMQVKLLRVLQSGEVQAVGGARLRKVDVRVLAATHRDLDQMVADGTFREDLLYRLRVVQLRVPPLRERVDDLPLLCEHFLTANREAGLGDVERITPAAFAVMRGYGWPGNIRELETFLKSACLFADGNELDVSDVHSLVEKNRRAAVTSGATKAVDAGISGVFATGSMADIELAIIADRLDRLGGNKSRTAESLGIDRGTLYTKLRRLKQDRAL